MKIIPSKTGHITDHIEETLIAVILAMMVLLTFANVVARFLNSNILWAVETTVFLFAWLVLLGASYAVKHKLHLGVDSFVNMLTPKPKRIVALCVAFCCLLYSILLLKGAWDYWSVFADLPPTTGKWFPTGFEDKFRSQSFYETKDIPMIPLFQFLEGWINYDERYEKLPRVIPYIILPLSSALLLFRFIQVTLEAAKGKIDIFIASHEAEDAVEEAAVSEVTMNELNQLLGKK